MCAQRWQRRSRASARLNQLSDSCCRSGASATHVGEAMVGANTNTFVQHAPLSGKGSMTRCVGKLGQLCRRHANSKLKTEYGHHGSRNSWRIVLVFSNRSTQKLRINIAFFGVLFHELFHHLRYSSPRAVLAPTFHITPTRSTKKSNFYKNSTPSAEVLSTSGEAEPMTYLVILTLIPSPATQ